MSRRPTPQVMQEIVEQTDFDSMKNHIIESNTQYILFIQKTLKPILTEVFEETEEDLFFLKPWENPFLSKEENELRKIAWEQEQKLKQVEKELLQTLYQDLCK